MVKDKRGDEEQGGSTPSFQVTKDGIGTKSPDGVGNGQLSTISTLKLGT
jgi:hypothetical protein